jgi:exonuclease VII large subunit
MSGPKVVRIVTREEIIAICEGHLQRLERAVNRWQTQATRLGELSEQECSASLERHARLRALLAEDQLAELQRAVPVEIEHLRRDLENREERAIIRAAERRQRDRRVQENAKTLLDALQTNPESVDQALLETLSRLASGASREDAERLLAEGFAHLSKANEEPTLSDTQRALAQQLKVDEPEVSLREWIAAREPDATRDVRLLRIARHIVELQLLQGAECAAPFLLALERAEA